MLMTPALRSAGQKASGELLDADPRLDRTVSAHVVGVEMGTLLRKLSDNRVFLRADRYCAPQKLQLQLKKRPLRVVMQSLADLLPGKWEQDAEKSGYTLIMDAQAVRRRERWQRLFREQEEFAREERRKALLKAMRSEPPPAGSTSADPAQRDADSRNRSNGYFFRALPSSLQESIAQTLNDTDQYITGPTNLSDVSAAPPHARLSELPDAAQTILRERLHSLADSTLRVPNDPLIFFQSTRYSVSLAIGGETKIVSDRNLPDIGWFAGEYVPGLGLDDRYERALKERGAKAPKAWSELAAYDRSRVWPNTILPPSKILSFPPTSRADLQQWLADRADIEYVSDYYARPGRLLDEAQRKRELQKPLTAELDTMARDQDVSWKQTAGQIYLFRNNRWYREDMAEAPGDLLTRWISVLQTEAALNAAQPLRSEAERWKAQMDFDSEIVSALDRWQIGRGLMCFMAQAHVKNEKGEKQSLLICPFSLMAPRLFRENALLSFYAGLSEAQRFALTSGALAAADLSLLQQQKLVSIAPDIAAQISAASPFIGLKTQAQSSSGFFQAPRLGAMDSRLDLTLALTPPAEKR